jgi:hypothetical protein
MSRIHRPMTGRRAGTMSKIALMAWVAALCACTSPPPTPEPVVAQVIPAGYGRLWLYRAYEPGDTLARPYVRLNNAVVGISDPGGRFYRDVPPGRYQVTVDSVGHDVNQFATVDIASGQQAYVKVESSALWESDLNYRADTFYTRQMPPEAAAAELLGTGSRNFP